MGCSTCKTGCGREEGCGPRKAEQKLILDELMGRLYPSRRYGEADAAACFRQGISEREARRHGQALSVLLKAPTYFRPGGEGDLCCSLYVLCLGREPSLLDAREAGLGLLAAQGDALPLSEAPSARAVVRERYLRISLSSLARVAAVQEVALELDLDRPGGLGVIREVPQPGVFDGKLLKRFQKIVDYLMASDVEHLDMGLLDLPAAQHGLEAGDYGEQYGAAPGLFNFLFRAEPVLTASAVYLPLEEGAAQAAG